ncbi:MAG: S-adenosylmethionine:tRNA ribosyltransferase-isomerase, partial [Candidatus Krumholzibacteriia bacterium]
MTLPGYGFELPPELVAQEPPARRGDSRLLLVAPGRGPVGERAFADLPALLRAGDLLVLNESRVLPARLFTRRTDTGGKVELLLVAPTASPRTWQALARPARRLRPGLALALQTGDWR